MCPQAPGTILPLSPLELDAYDPDYNNTLTFQLRELPFSDLFTMDGRSLVVDRRIDREAGVPGQVLVRVVVTDQTGLVGPSLDIDVTIHDVNDVAPVFDQQTYFGQVTGEKHGSRGTHA